MVQHYSKDEISDDQSENMKIKQLLRPKHLLSGIVAISFVVVTSTLILFFITGPFKESQDNRQQASTIGQAEIMLTAQPSSANVGDKVTISIWGLTNDVAVSGFQFVGLMNTELIDTATLSIETTSQSTMVQTEYADYALRGNEATFGIISIPPSGQATMTFPSTSNRELLATISFITKATGTIYLESVSSSKVIDSVNNNVLATIQDLEIPVRESDPDPTPTLTPAPTSTPAPTPDDSKGMPSPTPFKSFTPMPKPTVLPVYLLPKSTPAAELIPELKSDNTR